MTAASQRVERPLDDALPTAQIGEVPLRTLHTSFDKLDIAYCGALNEEALATLREAKSIAQERQAKVRVRIGGESVLVEHGGQQGGYAFVFDTGPTGERWSVKDNSDVRNWNILVKLHAAILAVSTPQAIREQLVRRIESLGLRMTDHSLNRVDYAIDLQMPRHFELNLDQVIAPSRSQLDSTSVEPGAISSRSISTWLCAARATDRDRYRRQDA